jgi:thiol-disulfide isomerase/thioredoxin
MNRPFVRGGIAAVVIAAIVGLVLWVQAGRDDGDAGASGDVAPVATETFYAAPVYTLCGDDVPEAVNPVAGGPPIIGQAAPDFALCDAGGSFVMRLSDMTGKVVWLNFWATWCVPCKKELPDIQALSDEKRDDGLEVLIINFRESREQSVRFLSTLGIEMPVVLDRQGSVYDDYRLAGLPDSFFIGRDGKLAAVYYGFVNEEIARERLAAAGLE